MLDGGILLLNFESLNLWMNRLRINCRFFEKFSVFVDKNGMSLFIFLWTFQVRSILMILYIIFFDLISFDLFRCQQFLFFFNYKLLMNFLDLYLMTSFDYLFSRNNRFNYRLFFLLFFVDGIILRESNIIWSYFG